MTFDAKVEYSVAISPEERGRVSPDAVIKQWSSLGQAGMNAGTYTVVERGPGQIYGKGQGIFMMQDGQAAIWNGHGVCRMDETGGLHVAASVAFQTTSAKLAKLNGILVLVEHHTDMENNARSDLFEWSV